MYRNCRRSGQGGYFLPLSGGVDSSSSAALVFSMCRSVSLRYTHSLSIISVVTSFPSLVEWTLPVPQLWSSPCAAPIHTNSLYVLCGYFLPLSGRVDSSSSAALVFSCAGQSLSDTQTLSLWSVWLLPSPLWWSGSGILHV